MTGIIIQQDIFGTAGALTTPWVTNSTVWTSDGNVVQPLSLPSVFQRAVQAGFDPGTFLSASTPPRMEYSVRFQMPAALPATGDLSVGLSFCGLAASGTPQGFEFYYYRTSGGTATSAILQMRPAASVSAINQVIGTVAVTALAAGTWNTLTVNVWFFAGNFNIATALNGGSFGYYTVPVAQWQATMAAATTPLTCTKYGGIFAQVAGTITMGPAFPGQFPYTLQMPTNPVAFDDFIVRDAGSLSNQAAVYATPTLAAAPSLTPITVAAEITSVITTLSVQPSRLLPIGERWEVVEQRFDNGAVSTFSRQTLPRRMWRFHWDALDATNRAALETFRDLVIGRVGTWSWTDPEQGLTVYAHFATDLAIVTAGDGVWQAEADVEERF